MTAPVYAPGVSERRLVEAALRYAADPSEERWQELATAAKAYAGAEPVKAGIAAAAARGQRIGKPVSHDAPDGAAVAELRSKGVSWAQVAERLGSDVSAVRRALRRHEKAEQSS